MYSYEDRIRAVKLYIKLGKRLSPDGHFKLPHLWPVKLPQAGRTDYDVCGVTAIRAAASFSR
jgi:hypothetical protein